MTTLANTARVLSWLQNKTEKRVFKTQKPRFFWQFSREFTRYLFGHFKNL